MRGYSSSAPEPIFAVTYSVVKQAVVLVAIARIKTQSVFIGKVQSTFPLVYEPCNRLISDTGKKIIKNIRKAVVDIKRSSIIHYRIYHTGINFRRDTV